MLEQLGVISLEAVERNILLLHVAGKRLHLLAEDDVDVSSHLSCVVLNQIGLEVPGGVLRGRNHSSFAGTILLSPFKYSLPGRGVSKPFCGGSGGSIASRHHIGLVDSQELLRLNREPPSPTIHSLVSLCVLNLRNKPNRTESSYRRKRSSQNGISPLHRATI